MRIKVTGLAFLLAALLTGSLNAALIQVRVEPCLIVKGQECVIIWRATGSLIDRVHATVWHGATLVTQFSNLTQIPGGTDNRQAWAVPASAPTGTYRFRVATADGEVQGECEQSVNAEGLYLAEPGPGGTLDMDSYCTVGWKAFGLPGVHSVVLELLRSGAYVGMIGSGSMYAAGGCGNSYRWNVGHLLDPDTGEPAPETVPAGIGYSIRIRYSGSVYVDTRQFAIGLKMDWVKERFANLRRLPAFRVPLGTDPCPMCVEIELQEFFEAMKTAPQRYEVELWASGRSLGRLLKSSPGKRPVQRIDLGNAFAQFEKGGGGFELRVFNARGNLVHKQAVTLQLSEKTPLIRK